MENLTKTLLAFQQKPRTSQINLKSLINDLGYQVINQFPQASLKLFELNTLSYPESANAYDSYAEALYQAGQYGKSKVNYKKAFDIDPSFAHIPERIEEIGTKL